MMQGSLEFLGINQEISEKLPPKLRRLFSPKKLGNQGNVFRKMNKREKLMNILTFIESLKQNTKKSKTQEMCFC